MAEDKKISGLTVATTPSGAELVEIVQGGVNKQTTVQEIADLGGGGSVESIVAGTNITVDDTDPANPIVSASSSGVSDGDKGDVVVTSSGTVWTVDAASETQAGKAEIATQAETNTGTDDARYITPLKLQSSKHTLVSASASTAGGTITLDMDSKIQKMFVGSASFSAAKIIAMSNTTGSLQFQFIFEVTNVAAVLTVPADWLMSSANFNGTDWTPPSTGKYVFGGMFDGTNWYVNDGGPYA